MIARGMLRVDVPPEGMLNAIGSVEDADAKPAIHLFQSIEEHLLPLQIHVDALLEETARRTRHVR